MCSVWLTVRTDRAAVFSQRGFAWVLGALAFAGCRAYTHTHTHTHTHTSIKNLYHTVHQRPQKLKVTLIHVLIVCLKVDFGLYEGVSVHTHTHTHTHTNTNTPALLIISYKSYHQVSIQCKRVPSSQKMEDAVYSWQLCEYYRLSMLKRTVGCNNSAAGCN